MAQDLAVLKPKQILPFRTMKMCATNQICEAQDSSPNFQDIVIVFFIILSTKFCIEGNVA